MSLAKHRVLGVAHLEAGSRLKKRQARMCSVGTPATGGRKRTVWMDQNHFIP